LNIKNQINNIIIKIFSLQPKTFFSTPLLTYFSSFLFSILLLSFSTKQSIRVTLSNQIGSKNDKTNGLVIIEGPIGCYQEMEDQCKVMFGGQKWAFTL